MIDSPQKSHKLALKFENLGDAKQAQGHLQYAIKSYKEAICNNPLNAELLLKLGSIFHQLEKLELAIKAYKQSLLLNRYCVASLKNLGLAYQTLNHLDLALAYYYEALAIEPSNLDIRLQLGTCLTEDGQVELAINNYQHCIKLKQDFAEAHSNLSHALLLAGRYTEGWMEFGWRRKKSHPILPSSIPHTKPWRGEEIHQHGTILLICEQGFGDTLQFMRYLPFLRKLGFNIKLCAQPELHYLIQTSEIDLSPLSPADVKAYTDGPWMPLLDIPGLLGVSPTTPLINSPYIYSPAKLTSLWAKTLQKEKRPIIGLCWQGDPAHERTNFRGRSLQLEQLKFLTKCTNGTFLSLQKGFGSEQLKECSFLNRFVGVQEHINQSRDFAETAALICNCDLVITIDTAVAHLAGGLGQPTWLLLKYVPEWRWGLKGIQTFWYPSIRLFRQHQQSNWTDLIKQVGQQLSHSALTSTMPLYDAMDG